MGVSYITYGKSSLRTQCGCMVGVTRHYAAAARLLLSDNLLCIIYITKSLRAAGRQSNNCRYVHPSIWHIKYRHRAIWWCAYGVVSSNCLIMEMRTTSLLLQKERKRGSSSDERVGGVALLLLLLLYTVNTVAYTMSYFRFVCWWTNYFELNIIKSLTLFNRRRTSGWRNNSTAAHLLIPI